jgi:hypothetical protein
MTVSLKAIVRVIGEQILALPDMVESCKAAVQEPDEVEELEAEF